MEEGIVLSQREQKCTINFQGDKVAFGPLDSKLMSLYHQWNNDFIVMRAISINPLTYEEQVRKFEEQIGNKNNVFFTIYEKQTLTPIGIASLKNISKRHATFSITIGERDYQGQGLGTEATQLMLDYAFVVLGLHNVMLMVFEFNQAGIRAYEKAGFKVTGRRREIKWFNGRLWDDIFMDCISTEYKPKFLNHLLNVDDIYKQNNK